MSDFVKRKINEYKQYRAEKTAEKTRLETQLHLSPNYIENVIINYFSRLMDVQKSPLTSQQNDDRANYLKSLRVSPPKNIGDAEKFIRNIRGYTGLKNDITDAINEKNQQRVGGKMNRRTRKRKTAKQQKRTRGSSVRRKKKIKRRTNRTSFR